MPHLVKTDELFDPINVRFFGAKAIVQVTNLFTQLVQQPGRLKNQHAGFSGTFMTVHLYSISAESHIASGFWQVRAPMLGRLGRCYGDRPDVYILSYAYRDTGND